MLYRKEVVMVDIKILRNTSDKIWQSCYQHPFVQEIGRGTLSREKFEFFFNSRLQVSVRIY